MLDTAPFTTHIRLIKPHRDARLLIQNQIKIGQAIQSQRIVYVEDLDQARSEKQEWVTRTTDLLKQLFSDGSMAEQCNDWVGPILPEHAEWDLFVEQFGHEMTHRIGRLATLLKRIDNFSEADPTEKSPPCLVPTPLPTPTIHWSGLLISHGADDAGADDAVERMVGDFLKKLGVPIETADRTPADDRTGQDLVEFALILKGSTATDGDDLFQLGFCVGRFGAARVCVLHRDNAPVVTHGVCHIQIDPAGAWQLALARQLKSGGATIDLNMLV